MTWDLGVSLGEHPMAPLGTALGHTFVDMRESDVALEFGVATGTTTREIARTLPVIGFDTFQGLPEDWRDGFPAGMFRQPSDVVFDLQGTENVSLEIGLFSDTLQGWDPPSFVRLIHIDCDLYSSTQTVLWHMARWVNKGLVGQGSLILFDEFHSYENGWEHKGEAQAWREFLEIMPLHTLTIGHGPEQLLLKIL